MFDNERVLNVYTRTELCGKFWIYLGGDSFSQRIGKILLGVIRNIEDLT